MTYHLIYFCCFWARVTRRCHKWSRGRLPFQSTWVHLPSVFGFGFQNPSHFTFMIAFIARVAWRIQLMTSELLTLTEHLRVFVGIVLLICFVVYTAYCRSSLLPLSFCFWPLYSLSFFMYCFWWHHWYRQAFGNICGIYGLHVLIVMFYDDCLCFAITLMINKRVRIVRNDMAVNEHERLSHVTP